MANSKGSMTLDEHYAQLKAEGRYEAVMERKRQQEEVRQRQAIVWQQAEAPLVNDLNRTGGVHVASVWDLVNTEGSYPEAIPILLDHLRRSYPERVREGIARALAVPDARKGWPILLQAFSEEQDSTTLGVKWALALALGASGTDAELDDVLPLLGDTSLGRNRVPLLSILRRSRDPRSRATLQQLADDEAIGGEARKILAKVEKAASKRITSKRVN